MAIQQSETAYVQITRRLLCLLGCLLLAVGCKKHTIPEPEPEPTPSGPAEHALLLYMPGQSLRSYYNSNIRNIEQAVTAQTPGNNRILVCYQPRNHTSALLLELRYDARTQQCVRDTLRVYEEFYPEKTASVDALFRDAQQLAPANSYGLMIGCHGTAWVPPGITLSLPQIPGATPFPGLLTRADEEEYAMNTRSFGDSGHQLAISDFAEVVRGLPYRFDYLIFDGCFMANIEMLYDLRDAFDYVVASPCEIMAAGFPYDRIIPDIFAASGPDLPAVCRDFWSFYMNDWNTVPNNAQSACISLAVMDELEALAACVADIQAGPLREYDPAYVQFYESMPNHLFYDLGHYLASICDDATLLARFDAQLDRAFPETSRLYTPRFYSAFSGGYFVSVEFYTGVSTSEPSNRYQTMEAETAWYRRTHADR